MIERLENLLCRLFQDQPDRSNEAVSAANLAMWELMGRPRLAASSMATHALVVSDKGHWRILGSARPGAWVDLNPLREIVPGPVVVPAGPASLGIFPDGHPPFRIVDGARSDPAASRPAWSDWPRALPGTVAPAAIQARARDWVRTLGRENPALAQALSRPPTPMGELAMEVLDHAGVLERTRCLLGDAADPSLWRHGLVYHQPAGDARHAQRHRYLLAHDGVQPAAVAGWTQDAGRLGLAYLAVAPAFRRLGLASRMFRDILVHAATHDLLLVRSSASDMARATGAKGRFDALALSGPALHVVGGTRLERALLDVRSATGRWPAGAKAACDRILLAQRRAADGWQGLDASVAQALRAPPSRPPRP